mmetsp:Transcript_34408/g.111065  ORF Transcript_34408/g.111065 Transcript_34408/m.111065 type:complete len:338 (-) Transcript_34408:287-1300(-)
MSENEVEVSSPPTDGVSALRFSPDGKTFAATSWDSVLRIYSVASADTVAKLPQPAPLLDCDFLGCDRVVSAASDGGLRLHEYQSGVERVLGRHASGIRCVRRCAAIGATVTGSWDRSIKLWDERVAEACIGTYAQPDKVFAMCKDVQGAPAPSVPLLVVATASRHVHILDLRKPSEPLQRRESALKCQTRAVAQMPSGFGYAMGSVEGRVAIEYFDPDAAAQEKRYAFKCHRTAVGGVDTSFPVNAICYHPTWGTFATGGCDGVVNVWDGAKKKRVCQFSRYSTSLSALDFSPDGTHLAIAASYTFECGDKQHPPDAIYLRRVVDADVRPKQRKSTS